MAPRHVSWLMTSVAAAVLLAAHLTFVEGQSPKAVVRIENNVKKVSTFLEEENVVEFLGGLLRISNITRPRVEVNGRMIVSGAIRANSIITAGDITTGN